MATPARTTRTVEKASLYGAVPTATAVEEELTRFFVGGCDVTVDGLSRLFRHLEPHSLAGLLLAHGCPIDSMTMGSNGGFAAAGYRQ